jgi:hypothetical protein
VQEVVPRRSGARSRARFAYTSFVGTGTEGGAQREWTNGTTSFWPRQGLLLSYGLVNRALEALILLMAVLIATCLLLVPTQGTVAAGVEVLAIGVIDWGAIVAIQLLQLRNWRSQDPSFRRHFVPRVVFGQAATLPFVVAGIALVNWGAEGLYLLVAGVVLSLVVGVIDAWVLLVEIHR